MEQTIREEMDADMERSGMAQGKIETQKLFKSLKSANEIDAIMIILSNYADYCSEIGAMVSVKRFQIVAEVLLEWWKNKMETPTDELSLIAEIKAMTE